MIEGIAGAATAMKQAAIVEAVGMSLMRMNQDMVQEQANALTKMMSDSMKNLEMAVAPHLGANLDILA